MIFGSYLFKTIYYLYDTQIMRRILLVQNNVLHISHYYCLRGILLIQNNLLRIWNGNCFATARWTVRIIITHIHIQKKIDNRTIIVPQLSRTNPTGIEHMQPSDVDSYATNPTCSTQCATYMTLKLFCHCETNFTYSYGQKRIKISWERFWRWTRRESNAQPSEQYATYISSK